MESKKICPDEDKVSNMEFFKSYYNLKNTAEEEMLKKFASAKSDEERIRIFSEIAATVKAPRIDWMESGKNFEEAKRLKELGNQAFARSDNEQALNLYTESLICMPCNDGTSSAFAIILANRSATLYHMANYAVAIRDIDYALGLDYPGDLRYKILERKAKCFLALERHSEAINEFRNTLTALDDCKLATEKKLKMQMSIQIMLQMMTRTNKKSTNVSPGKGRPNSGKKESEVRLCSGRHKVYVSCCDKVDIFEEPIVGRYAAAVADIEVGDVLLIEKPHCSVPLAEFSRLHCLHCFKKIKAPYPCKNCTLVVFCSKECQNAAEENYHKYECPIMETVHSSGASIMVLMALRIITQKPLNYFQDMKNSLTDERKEFKQYRSSDYETLYHLVRHENLRKTNDFFDRTVMTFFLLLCLRKGNYFPHVGNGENLTDDEVFIGSLILRHLQILQFNAHEIFQIELKTRQKLDQSRSNFIGGGIYPTLSLFNHSCDPGVVRYFKGSTAIIRAIKPIQKGEVIGENYGPLFTREKRTERRAKLKSQYWFDCECIPCIENWPTFEEMDANILRFRCDSRGPEDEKINACRNVILVPLGTNEFMAKCHSCGQFTNLLKGLKILQDTDAMYRQATRDADAGNIKTALAIYLEILTVLDSVMAPPFRDYHLCQQAIRQCLLATSNEFDWQS